MTLVIHKRPKFFGMTPKQPYYIELRGDNGEGILYGETLSSHQDAIDTVKSIQNAGLMGFQVKDET